ncbi:hypothetical protein BHE74_00037834 [Ensete ventricosum]|uniref:Uncharacterized protein n=1 Tax=Ensete ventricosum TaxID=4639 RepID=A0A427A7C2_ENSVE|nr:hypothetical protein B296_00027186 [Ensete ventricosum]RWW00423.1 hypothetical protein GW17_00036616 [Ensete ventricosum]RWW55528.1 hypothetical protein BHE74_00037834 [Ensete ventricosum]RZR93601.1 hypothetical protein BHM03_00022155 [Ensete ventricosum]
MLIDSSIELKKDLSNPIKEMQRTILEFDKKLVSHCEGLQAEDEKHFRQSWKYASKDEANCSIDYLQQSKEDEEHVYDTNDTDKELLER